MPSFLANQRPGYRPHSRERPTAEPLKRMECGVCWDLIMILGNSIFYLKREYTLKEEDCAFPVNIQSVPRTWLMPSRQKPRHTHYLPAVPGFTRHGATAGVLCNLARWHLRTFAQGHWNRFGTSQKLHWRFWDHQSRLLREKP